MTAFGCKCVRAMMLIHPSEIHLTFLHLTISEESVNGSSVNMMMMIMIIMAVCLLVLELAAMAHRHGTTKKGRKLSHMSAS